jgi:hypothetical protein
MEERSHVDVEKIKQLHKGDHFEYRDVVSDTFPKSAHSYDGALFNKEVEAGVYENVEIINENFDHVRYKRV